jgi:hypothetical protein
VDLEKPTNIQALFMKKVAYILCSIVLVFMLFVISNPVNTKAENATSVTKWVVVNSSLADLLNDGWKIINHSYSDSRTSASPGVSETREVTISYLLTKDNKYINCSLFNPFPGKRNISGCRSIN